LIPLDTAKWPKDYQKPEWKEESVAIIGSGASSIQTLPNMQPYVKHIDVYVRTPVWFIDIAGNDGMDKKYSREQQEDFRKDIKSLVKHAKELEDKINGPWSLFFNDSDIQKEAKKMLSARMAEFIKDERLLQGFTPEFAIGCRRVTPGRTLLALVNSCKLNFLGDPYMKAIQEDNVDVHFSAVQKITEDSVIDSEGEELKVDTIICATGFDVSYKPRFPIVGHNGVDLRERWKVCPESYLGLAIPEIPNFITFIGPTWPVENGSVMGPLGKVGDYAIKIIKKMQTDFIKSIVPKQDVTDAFNEHTQEFIKRTVWVSGCRSWYRSK
jgi:cation diffusion facilitator CzcD-associated flavoprotein CzcO